MCWRHDETCLIVIYLLFDAFPVRPINEAW